MATSKLKESAADFTKSVNAEARAFDPFLVFFSSVLKFSEFQEQQPTLSMKIQWLAHWINGWPRDAMQRSFICPSFFTDQVCDMLQGLRKRKKIMYFEFVFQTERRRAREVVPEYRLSLCLLVCCSYKNHMRFNHFHVIVIYWSVDETPCFKIVGAYLKRHFFNLLLQIVFLASRFFASCPDMCFSLSRARADYSEGRKKREERQKEIKKRLWTGCFLTALTSIHLRMVSFSASSKIFTVM